MSTEIENKVVSMKFDNSNVESNIKTSITSFGKLKDALDFSGSSKSMNDLTTTAGNVDISPLGSAADGVGQKFSALGAMAFGVFAKIGADAFEAGKKLLASFTTDPIKDGFAEYETKMGSIQTIMSNTMGANTMEEVTAAIGELNTYADKTIYNFSEMTRNIGKIGRAHV